jgi:hypothetical protein
VGPVTPARLTARDPEDVAGQIFLQPIIIHLTTKGIHLVLAGTTFAHSSGVPRVGLLASRAMVGVPLKAAAGQATTVKLQTLIKSSLFLTTERIDTESAQSRHEVSSRRLRDHLRTSLRSCEAIYVALMVRD